MKTQWLLLTALAVLLVGSAIAQNDFTQKMTGNVPFDFVVNGTTLPKGEYVVSAPSDGRKLLIQNKNDPQYSTYVLNTDVPLGIHKTHSEAKMVFVRTNGQHVLHQISVTGDNHTHDIVHGADVIELVATR
jgi:hypothetical protein